MRFGGPAQNDSGAAIGHEPTSNSASGKVGCKAVARRTSAPCRVSAASEQHRDSSLSSCISPRFRPQRHTLTAAGYGTEVHRRFASWAKRQPGWPGPSSSPPRPCTFSAPNSSTQARDLAMPVNLHKRATVQRVRASGCWIGFPAGGAPGFLEARRLLASGRRRLRQDGLLYSLTDGGRGSWTR